jgi:2-haloacid dehalogenase
MGAQPACDTVVFDFGGVLLDWDPRHLYRKLFDDPARMEWFLAEVCSPAWNLAQDGGRSWADAEAEAIARHPAEAELIRAYRSRWHEMIAGPIAGTVALLEDLAAAGVPLYGITNFAADTCRETIARNPFFGHFKGIVISGEVNLLKPDPRIFHRLADDHGVELTRAVFIDDVEKNCAGARRVGMAAIRFVSPAQTRADLAAIRSDTAAMAAARRV